MGWHSAVTLLYTDSTLLKDSLKRVLFLPAFAEVSSHFGRPTGQGAGGSSVVVVSKKSGPSVLYRHASFDCALLHHSSQRLHFFYTLNSRPSASKNITTCFMQWSGTEPVTSLRYAHSLKGMNSANTRVSLEADSWESGFQMRSAQLTPCLQPWGALSRGSSEAVPNLLTQRNYEIIDGCLKLLSLWQFAVIESCLNQHEQL